MRLPRIDELERPTLDRYEYLEHCRILKEIVSKVDNLKFTILQALKNN